APTSTAGSRCRRRRARWPRCARCRARPAWRSAAARRWNGCWTAGRRTRSRSCAAAPWPPPANAWRNWRARAASPASPPPPARARRHWRRWRNSWLPGESLRARRRPSDACRWPDGRLERGTPRPAEQDAAVNETPPSRRPSTRALAWLLVPLVLVLAGAFAWHAWRQQQARLHDRNADQARQLETLIARMDNLRSDLATQSRLIRDASNANRVLRDEVLGLGQRNALLEDNVARLAASSRDGSRSARLDEAELLLVMAAQRLRGAGDVERARRAYALAASLLEGLHDPGLLNLRQTLAEERAALDRLGPGPRAAIAARLDAVAARLADLPL